jgi:hypothetical protein
VACAKRNFVFIVVVNTQNPQWLSQLNPIVAYLIERKHGLDYLEFETWFKKTYIFGLENRRLRLVYIPYFQIIFFATSRYQVFVKL